jgi:cardiolipin synthase
MRGPELPDLAEEIIAADDVSLWRRLAWPAAIGAAWLGWYASESLRHRREDQDGYEARSAAPPSSDDFRRASEALTGHLATGGNRAELLVNGDRIFPPILEAIRGAEHSIHLETYVYWRGEIADEVAEAIRERASAGVECRVLLDAAGSAKMRPALVRELRDAGARVIRFRPPKPHLIGRVANRSHRRVIVVDGRVGFTGGVGIADEWTGDAEGPDHWRDTHLRIEGPAVQELQGTFAEHWVEATGEALIGERLLPEIEPIEDGVPMQIVRSGSAVGDSNVEVLYFLAIASAEHALDLTAAYFAPRPPFVQALCDAAQRGVRVRILVPGPHADKKFVRLAGRNIYADLLEGGVEVYEYQPTMLHAKSLIVDGCWCSIGTVNFDNRSFQLNDELTVSIFDGGLAEQLGDAFKHDLSRAERIDPERWPRRGGPRRLAEKLTTLIRREL